MELLMLDINNSMIEGSISIEGILLKIVYLSYYELHNIKGFHRVKSIFVLFFEFYYFFLLFCNLLYFCY